MNKEEQVKAGFRNVYNKMAWLNKMKMEKKLSGYKPSEVHCIEFIGQTIDANVTKVAESLFMTRGAISKITQKLLKKEVIESYQKPDNKKEVYFKLTEKGKKVYDMHEKLHNEFEQRDQPVFDQLTETQVDSMLRFIETYNQHLDIEMKKQETNHTSI